MIDHIVYLSNTSGLKMGITRHSQVPTRWIDQGAVTAIPMLRVASRYLSGLVEVACKNHVADRTNWRAMLKGDVPELDLVQERERLLDLIADDLAHYYLSSEQINSAVTIGERLVKTGVEVAGGFLIQAMPGADDGDVGRLIERLDRLPSIADLLSASASLEDMIQRIMPDAEIVAEQSVQLKCNCSREKFARRLCTLGADELTRLTEELDVTEVECHFCRTQYAFDREQVNALLYGARMYDEAD